MIRDENNRVKITFMTIATKNISVPSEEDNSLQRIDLPSPDTKRWVARRKAQVVYAVQSGAISLTDACERYSLSVEEFLCWQSAIENNGIQGLRATRLQKYRAETMTAPAKI